MPPERDIKRVEFDEKVEDRQQMRRPRVRTVSFAEKHDEQGGSHIICFRKFVGNPMDRYLSSIGLTERSIKQDNGLSFYRAICEEIYRAQTPSILSEVKQLIDVSMEFAHIKTDADFEGAQPKKECLLKDQKILTTAKIFEATIQVFREPNIPPEVYYPPKGISPFREILLTEITPGHFNRVVKKHTAHTAGHAQAILYRTMYEKVFGLRSELIDEGIRHTRENAETWSWGEKRDARHERYHPPIPFCMLKVMDPCIYRNVSYDSGSKKKQKKIYIPKMLAFPVRSLCAFYYFGMTEFGTVAAIFGYNKRVLKMENGTMKVARVSDLISMEPSDSSTFNRAPGAQVNQNDVVSRFSLNNLSLNPYANTNRHFPPGPIGQGIQAQMNPPLGPPPSYYPSGADVSRPSLPRGGRPEIQNRMSRPMGSPPAYYVEHLPTPRRPQPMGGFSGNQPMLQPGPIVHQQVTVYGWYETPDGTVYVPVPVMVPIQTMNAYYPISAFLQGGHPGAFNPAPGAPPLPGPNWGLF